MGKVTSLPGASGAALISPPEVLSDQHDISEFNSGRPVLDDWLRNHALRSEGKSARTFIVTIAGRVVGYYCLAAGSVERDSMPTASLRKNGPAQTPVVVLGRLAVDKSLERRGIGSGLLRDAFARAIQASATIGIRAILVHPLDDEAAAFYTKYGFIPSKIAERTMFLPIETVADGLNNPA